ncbi:hypothetical protein CK203_061690 [Vitis vinifera]|uniref:Uncharacterized protein n=1 Tax=Vitis vinifera TaxID=29760 RepID=A0A438G834_VITVI|nr:hypothetical protein CK203_061690 [Vitis vinifera]
MSTVSIASGNIEGHILPFHSVCLPQVHDQRQMIQRVGPLGSPFHLEMFWISSLSKPHIQLGFFIQQSASGADLDQIHGSPSHFDGSLALCQNLLVISAAIRHRARIP